MVDCSDLGVMELRRLDGVLDDVTYTILGHLRASDPEAPSIYPSTELRIGPATPGIDEIRSHRNSDLARSTLDSTISVNRRRIPLLPSSCCRPQLIPQAVDNSAESGME